MKKESLLLEREIAWLFVSGSNYLPESQEPCLPSSIEIFYWPWLLRFSLGGFCFQNRCSRLFQKDELYHPALKRNEGGLLLLSQLESSCSICRLVMGVAPPIHGYGCWSVWFVRFGDKKETALVCKRIMRKQVFLWKNNKQCPTLYPHSSLFSLKLETQVLTHRSRTTSLMRIWMALWRGTLFNYYWGISSFFLRSQRSLSSVRRMSVRDPWSDENQRGRAPPRPSSVCYHATGKKTSFFFTKTWSSEIPFPLFLKEEKNISMSLNWSNL